MLFRSGFLGALFIAVLTVTTPMHAGVPVGDALVLDADFDVRMPGDALGQGGAAAGEPVDLSSLDGLIVEDTPGDNFLRVSNNSGNSNGRSLRWQLLNSAEITSGMVTISFTFTPSALERYSLGVRESGGSSRLFLALTFTSGGTFSGTDAAGVITLTNDTFAADVEMAVIMKFDMDARTSEMTVNGLPVFSGRSHGITDRGVGRILTGYASSNTGNPFDLDDFTVNGSLPLPLVLDADFDDKPIGQPIGVGGAEVGEPATISNGLVTTIIDPAVGNPILRLQNTTMGAARAMRWELLDNLEVESGLIAFDVDIEFAMRDNYQVLIREASGSGSSFATFRFFSAGNITLTDSNGAASLPPFSYNAGQTYRLRLIYDVGAGTYSVFIDDTELVADRAHGVSTGRGLGSIIFAFQSNASAAAEFTIDALQVGAADAPIIPSQLAFLVEPTSGFVNRPLMPAVEVGVVNVFDEVIGDGTMVEVGIETGPGAAMLSGEFEPTVAGTARFDSLQVDLPGIYRLQARAGRATVDSLVNIAVMPLPDSIFRDDFE